MGGPSTASAEPLPPAVVHREQLSGGAAPERFLLFGGFDIWRFGFTGYAGLHWAPRSLDMDGFVLRVFASEGIELYDGSSIRYRTAIFRASVLPGWQFKRGKLEVRLFAGPDFERDEFSPRSLYQQPVLNSLGLRGAIDLWWEPSAATMLSASASATTIAAGYNARIAAGWRVFDAGWVGPELMVSADRFSQQYRAGLHLTGFRTSTLEWSFAAGIVQDNFHRTGSYGRISLVARR